MPTKTTNMLIVTTKNLYQNQYKCFFFWNYLFLKTECSWSNCILVKYCVSKLFKLFYYILITPQKVYLQLTPFRGVTKYATFPTFFFLENILVTNCWSICTWIYCCMNSCPNFYSITKHYINRNRRWNFIFGIKLGINIYYLNLSLY